MAGELASNPPSSLPIRAFLGALLLSTTLSVWLGSADPWWRPKEWAALLMGVGWIIVRNWGNLRPIRSGQDRFFVFLSAALLIHFCAKFIYPVVKAPGSLSQSPFSWLAFLHIVVALVWLTDLRRLIQKDDIRFLVRVMAFLGIGLAAYMLGQYLGFDPIIAWVKRNYPNFKWLDPNHVIGLMGSPFQAAASLAVLVPAVAFEARSSRTWRIFLALCLFSCWITGSISSFLASVIGSVYALRIIRNKKEFVIGLAAGIFLLGILFLLKPDIFLDHGRLSILKQSLPHIQAHLFLGVGLNRFRELGIAVVDGNPYSVWWAHNEPLHFTVELGIPLSLLLFAYLARQTILLHRIHLGMFGCMTTLLILSLFHIPFHLAPTLAVMGLCLVASHIEPN